MFLSNWHQGKSTQVITSWHLGDMAIALQILSCSRAVKIHGLALALQILLYDCLFHAVMEIPHQKFGCQGNM